jgi:hypothetical protein
MLSALTALGHHRPNELNTLVNPLEDGSFNISFPGKPTVNARPEQGGGTFSDGNWIAAIEAAALQYTDADKVRVLAFGEGIDLLTGHGRSAYRNALGAGFAPLTRFRRRREWFENRVHTATSHGRVIVLGGSDGEWTTPKVEGLIPQHCYALLRFEPEFGTCRIRDPRGLDDLIPQGRKRDGYGPAEFWLTSQETEGSFCGLTIEDED